jgi:hypothetical protein
MTFALTNILSALTIIQNTFLILLSDFIIITSTQLLDLTAPTHKAIHICNSLKATTPPKIAKEYVFPTHTPVQTPNFRLTSKTQKASG